MIIMIKRLVSTVKVMMTMAVAKYDDDGDGDC